ncbi:MAG TPA: cation transporter [Clostridiales bacterium]|jgi:cation diffusion facilitator family transporter|nr:cation transporter [Clostridiales bacterium]
MDTRIKALQKINIISLIVNTLLAIMKIITGVFALSAAIMADGVHSLSDIGTTIISMIAVGLSSEKSDKHHPYGHERIEFVISIIIAFLLIITAGGFLITSIKGLVLTPEPIKYLNVSVIIMVISILMKEGLYQISIRASKKYHSQAIKAAAIDNRTDALSSIAVLIGLIFAYFGIYFMEQVASIIVAGIILFEAIKIIVHSAKQLIDSSVGEDIENKIRERTMKMTDVLAIESLKTRKFGARLYVDIDIIVDKNVSFERAHEISHNVHDLIEKEFNAKHVQVHTSPSK